MWIAFVVCVFLPFHCEGCLRRRRRRRKWWILCLTCSPTLWSPKKRMLRRSQRNACWEIAELNYQRIYLKMWVVFLFFLLVFQTCNPWLCGSCTTSLPSLFWFATAWHFLLRDEWEHLEQCAVRLSAAAPSPVLTTVSGRQYFRAGQHHQRPVQRQKL